MLNNKISENQTRQLLTVRQLSERHPAFPQSGIRYLIFHSQKNGFANCIRRVGRKILIDEALFFNWVEAQNQKVGG